MNRFISSFLFMAALWLPAQADDVHFTYDNGGNRTSRVIVIAPLAQTRSAGTEEADSSWQQPFTDIFADHTLRVWPNPTEGHLRIELEGLPEGDFFGYVIVSSNGKQVVAHAAASSPSEADLSTCPPGLYILKLFYKEVTREFKIIKL